MNTFEKLLTSFSFGSLALAVVFAVLAVVFTVLFIKSRKEINKKTDIEQEDIAAHRKKRTMMIVFIIIFAVICDLTCSAFIVKGVSSNFSYVFFPIYSTTVSGDVLTVSPLIEYETEAKAHPDVTTRKGSLSKGEETTFSFTAKANGSYLFRVTEMSDGMQIKINFRDKDGNNIDYANGVKKYTVAPMDNVKNGVRYTVTLTAVEGEGKYEIEIIEPKNFDIKHYTAIKDSLEYNFQSNIYYYTAPWDGVYSFYLTDVDYRCNIGIGVPDAEEKVYEDDDLVTIGLEGGKTYRINVNQMKGYCDYTLNEMRQKDTIDISDITEVNDSFEFVGQQNRYSFSGRTEIEMRFETNGTYAAVVLADENNNIVHEGNTVRGYQRVVFPNLDPAKRYVVIVISLENNGEYKFTIE